MKIGAYVLMKFYTSETTLPTNFLVRGYTNPVSYNP